MNIAKLLYVTFLMGIVTLGGCASAPDPKTSIASTTYGPGNAGLVVGRTIATNDPWIGHRGLALNFRNVTTGEVFSTTAGLSGYTSFERFAIWLPPGEYILAGIFAYNGSLGPADSPFTFKVSRGEGSYVGTLVMSWEVPKNVLELGRPVIVRRHGRLHCATFFSCNVFAPNGGVVKAPYADVAVFDEGPGFLMGLKVEYPNLPDIAITGGLMH